jgi:hypothetical protein
MDVEDLTPFKIQDYGHIVMPFADREFVHSEVSNILKLSPFEFICQMFLEDLLDQIPTHGQKKGHVLNGGNAAQVNHVSIKGFEPPPFAFGKIDGFSQGTTTMIAVLKMTMKKHKLGSSAYRQRSKTALESSLHDQLIPPSTTTSTSSLVLFLITW